MRAEPAIPDELIEALAARGRLVGVSTLYGGTSCLTQCVHLAHPDGNTDTVVLRRPHPGADMASVLEREWETLRLARRLGLPAPEPLLLHRESGRPAALAVAHVPGRTAVVVDDVLACARQFAETLAAIHTAPVRAVELAHLRPARAHLQTWLERKPRQPDVSLQEPGVRAALHACGAVPPTRHGVRLLHGDFWPGNVMWHNGAISAVLDWEDAMAGEPLVDVAVTRLDLLWAHGATAMDTFTGSYAQITGFDLAELPYWDLWAATRVMGALPAWARVWPAIGRPDVTPQVMTIRHRHFTAAALAAL